MTAVIAQSFSSDGGLLVMGANILNIGLITVVIGYGLYRAAFGMSRRIKLVAAGFAPGFL
jgi:cobalt/nickel transport system permease protein